MNNLNINLQAFLSWAGLPASKLARLTGLNQPTLHRILKGTSIQPRYSTIKPIAIFLGVNAEDLRTKNLSAYFEKNGQAFSEWVASEPFDVNIRPVNLNLPSVFPEGDDQNTTVSLTTPSLLDGTKNASGMAEQANLSTGLFEHQPPPKLSSAPTQPTHATLPATHQVTSINTTNSKTPTPTEETVNSSFKRGSTVEMQLGRGVNQMAGLHDPDLAVLEENLRKLGQGNDLDAIYWVGQRSVRLAYTSDKLGVKCMRYRIATPAHQDDQRPTDPFRLIYQRTAPHIIDLALIKRSKPEMTTLLIIMCSELPKSGHAGLKHVQWVCGQFNVHPFFADDPEAATQWVTGIHDSLTSNSGYDSDEFEEN